LVFSIFGKGFGDYLVWHLSYASNFLLVKNGSGFLGAHFWSLAVEEQFYLIFPVLLFLCKPRWESALVGTLICIGVISRIAFWNFDAPYPYLDRLLTTNLDSLGLGAALALGKMRGQSNRIMLLISGLSLIVAVLFGNDATVMHFILLPVFSIVIAMIDRNQDTLLIRALELQPLRYIGTISYGLYVWHYLLWQNRSEFEYFYQVLNSIHPILQYGHSERLVIGTLSLVISIVSWELFEKKILALKNRFSYS
jgi:peptidoglycan/LPS O-acetylase OafA/YrhL